MEMFTFPNCRTSIWLAILFVLWTIVILIICVITNTPSYLYSTLLYGITTGVLAIAFRTKVMDRSILRFNNIGTKTLLLAVGGTLCIPWVHALIHSVIPYPEFLTKEFAAINNERVDETQYIFYIISAILTPFTIEIIFRGVILRGLLLEYNTCKSIVIAAIIYAVVWGCITLLPILGLLYGLWFGWLYVHSRSLWTSLIAFIALQLMSAIYSIIGNYFTISPQVESAMTGDSWIVNLIMTVLFCIPAYFLHLTFKHNGN